MEDPQRPLPPRSLVDRVRSWTEWIGYGRIVGSALAMVIVCAGGYWLMRMPPPPTEASLPFASTSTGPQCAGMRVCAQRCRRLTTRMIRNEASSMMTAIAVASA